MSFGEQNEQDAPKDEAKGPLMRIEMHEEIDSEDSYWQLLARPDNPVKRIRREIKSLRK